MRTREGQYRVGIAGHGPAQLVHGAMVPTAQRDQVVQVREPTVGPMLNVVDVRELRVPAAGEPTPPVTPIDLHTLHGCRIPPDPTLIHDRPVPTLNGEIHSGVTRQPPDDLD